MTLPTRLGAIDAGSNAIRAVVAELSPSGALTRVESVRAAVRLGHGAFTVGELDHATIDAAVAAFADFARLFQEHHVEHYRAIATSAVRNARNRDVLLHRIYAETGIELEPVTGEEEARLVRKAVRNAYRGRPAPTTILDLGGGSLELNVRNVSRWTEATLPLGTVRLMEFLGLEGSIGEAEAGMIRRLVSTLVHTVLPDPKGRGFEPAVACGGNAEAYATLLGAEVDGAQSFTLRDLDRALPELLAADVPTRMSRYGVRRDRAEVMGIAGLVFSTVARELGITQLLVPGVGLRDALLFELAATLPELREKAVDARAKAALTSARMFAARLGHDPSHGEQVLHLARALFDQLQPLHKLRPELRHVLEIACVLHDVGEVVHVSGHHKHGEYMVRWGRLHGLEGDQRKMVAALVRAHRKSPPSAPKHPSYTELSASRRAEVEKLLPVLRLADGLDTAHRQRVRAVTATVQDKKVTLALDVEGPPPADPSLYLRKVQLFEQTFGVTVSLAP